MDLMKEFDHTHFNIKKFLEIYDKTKEEDSEYLLNLISQLNKEELIDAYNYIVHMTLTYIKIGAFEELALRPKEIVDVIYNLPMALYNFESFDSEAFWSTVLNAKMKVRYFCIESFFKGLWIHNIKNKARKAMEV